MARTFRNIPYKHYWGESKAEAKKRWEDVRDGKKVWSYFTPDQDYIDELKRDYHLHGTESRNYCYPTHWYFNRVHRIGRALERNQLRPHKILEDDFDFDDSHYRAHYKGVWWEIY